MKKQIKPYPKNAKQHPEKQIELIARSIQRFGWQQPIKLGKDGYIIVGHGRHLAYEKYKDTYSLKVPWVIDDEGKTIQGEAAAKHRIKQEQDGKYYSYPTEREIIRDNTNINIKVNPNILAKREWQTPEEIATQRQQVRQESSNNPLNQWGLSAIKPSNFTRENVAQMSQGLESMFRVNDKPNFFDGLS